MQESLVRAVCKSLHRVSPFSFLQTVAFPKSSDTLHCTHLVIIIRSPPHHPGQEIRSMYLGSKSRMLWVRAPWQVLTHWSGPRISWFCYVSKFRFHKVNKEAGPRLAALFWTNRWKPGVRNHFPQQRIPSFQMWTVLWALVKWLAFLWPERAYSVTS